MIIVIIVLRGILDFLDLKVKNLGFINPGTLKSRSGPTLLGAGQKWAL